MKYLPFVYFCDVCKCLLEQVFEANTWLDTYKVFKMDLEQNSR